VGIEIERKFLVRNDQWRGLAQGVSLRQGYLSAHPDRIVRVRIEGASAMLTIKGRTVSASRAEWEYPIALNDAAVMLSDLCERPIIDKTRYRIMHDGMCWEVDEFHGENAGLIIAEIELVAEDQSFSKPDWIGDEVTSDSRYFNANLLRHPYRCW
jgi:adenylate cyclase